LKGGKKGILLFIKGAMKRNSSPKKKDPSLLTSWREKRDLNHKQGRKFSLEGGGRRGKRIFYPRSRGGKRHWKNKECSIRKKKNTLRLMKGGRRENHLFDFSGGEKKPLLHPSSSEEA